MEPSRESGHRAWLAPSWNLASMLVPVVAMAGWLLLRSTAPAVQPAPAAVVDRPLEVYIDADGYLVDGVAGLPGVRPDGTLRIPCRDGDCATVDDYDTDGLTEILAQAQVAGRERLDLVPAWDTPYVVLVRTLEAARGDDDLFTWVRVRRPG